MYTIERKCAGECNNKIIIYRLINRSRHHPIWLITFNVQWATLRNATLGQEECYITQKGKTTTAHEIYNHKSCSEYRSWLEPETSFACLNFPRELYYYAIARRRSMIWYQTDKHLQALHFSTGTRSSTTTFTRQQYKTKQTKTSTHDPSRPKEAMKTTGRLLYSTSSSSYHQHLFLAQPMSLDCRSIMVNMVLPEYGHM